MFRKIVYFHITIICFVFVSNCIATSDLPYKEGELLVRFAPKAEKSQHSTDERNQILASFNAGTVKTSFKLVPGLSLVKLPVNLTVADALPKLQGKSEILYVEPNYKIRLASTFPNDTRFDELWAMHNTGQTGGTVDADIDAPEAWNIITDSNIIVAVIDTGVDYTHSDLSANMWVNEAELNGEPGVDDDDPCNGYVDDIYGWDFADDDNNPTDYDGHGTHCSGTIGAVGNNGEGVTGICWNVKIMALKIFPCYGEETFISSAINAIEYGVNNGAGVLSNSWDIESYSQAIKDEIKAADACGVLFVAAAGNDGDDNDSEPYHYPSGYDCNNIISVMATDYDDKRSIWPNNYSSNFGLTTVDLGAPGSYILSCVPGNDYDSWHGTSMATPHVAGACALVWAANPQLTHLEVKDYILQGVDELDSLDGKCVSGGRLNLLQAVKGKKAFPSLTLSKDVDDANCVYPFVGWGVEDNYLIYDICYDANGSADTNAVIVDYLPDEVEYYTSDPCGTYDQNDHTVTWDIGDISVEDSNCIIVTVKVTTDAVPGGTITNTCEIEGDNYVATASKVTCVECWAGDLLYVDADANEGGDGFSWDSAYNDLQEAIDVAGTYDCYTAIWVAEGNYPPVESTDVENYKDYSFELLENVALYGHFGGIGTYEKNAGQRDFADANNETILEGRIGDTASEAVEDIVTAKDIGNGKVDGFTIKGSYSGAGIYLLESDVSILNCKFKNNHEYGVEIGYESEPDIHNCLFMDNTSGGVKATSWSQPIVSYCIFDGNDTTDDGIYMRSDSVMVVSDCVFKKHTDYGIDGGNGTLTVTDCNFDDNQSGFYLSDVDTTITNCSIKNSDYYGMRCHSSVLTVEHSVIAKNGTNGLYTNDCELTLENSVVRDSGGAGLNLSDNSATTLTNNWIHNNGTDQSQSKRAGIYFYAPSTSSVPLVRNNTIYGNYTYGIQVTAYDYYVEPNVINCIIYDNGSNDFFRNSGTFDTVNYCCLEDGHTGNGNITTAPTFKTTEPNDFHLDETDETPQCKDFGDPNGSYGDETDIDGEERIKYGRVDIGGDEYYYSPADFNDSGNVDSVDYSMLAAAWQSEYGEPNYNEDCDLEDNNSIDFNDLALFCEDWLWEKAWGDEGWMMCMGGGGMDFGLEGLESGELMMLDVETILATRPERLIAKGQKFYDITPETTINAQEVDIEQNITEILEWLDGIWLNGDLKEIMTEEQYLVFRKTIEELSK